MSISEHLEYAIKLWKEYNLRERIALSLTFENPELLPFFQLRDEIKLYQDKEEEFPQELEIKMREQDIKYLNHCRDNIHLLLQILNVSRGTEIQVITSNDNANAIGDINNINNTILNQVLEKPYLYEKDDITIGKCSYENLEVIIDGIIGADFPNSYDTEKEYEDKTIATQTLFYFPSSGFIFYLYDGRGGIVSSVIYDSELLSELLIQVTREAPHILNQYWFQKSCCSIYLINESKFLKNENTLRSTGKLDEDMRWVIGLFYEDNKVRHEFQYVDINKLKIMKAFWPEMKTRVNIYDANLTQTEKDKLFERDDVKCLSQNWDKSLTHNLFIIFEEGK